MGSQTGRQVDNQSGWFTGSRAGIQTVRQSSRHSFRQANWQVVGQAFILAFRQLDRQSGRHSDWNQAVRQVNILTWQSGSQTDIQAGSLTGSSKTNRQVVVCLLCGDNGLAVPDVPPSSSPVLPAGPGFGLSSLS